MKKKTMYTILIIILILTILSLCFVYYFKKKDITIDTINKELKENTKEVQNKEITNQEDNIDYSDNIQISEESKITSKKKINIIDESPNSNCASAIEYYYEDTNYKYYFTCIKSGNIFVIVNGVKYNIKEVLNNKIVTIAELEEAGFSPLKEEKNTQKY